MTFVLDEADPEFLYKLTYFIYPTPPGTPIGEVESPVLGTGPYRIAEYAKGKVFRLERNPNFHQWSFAAQPDGYPQSIVWLRVPDLRAAATAVTEGKADLAALTPLNDRRSAGQIVDELQVHHPTQLRHEQSTAVEFVLLNTRLPPFNSRKARQAVNFAVDRNRLVEIYGGASVAVPTCQLIPPDFPGWLRNCPYTLRPTQDGGYHGPDMATAQRLVEESSTRGQRVTVYDVQDGLSPQFGPHIRDVLHALGYRVTLKTLPLGDADFLFDPSNRVQVMGGYWGADYPLPATFYDGVTACHAYADQYCNTGLDHRAALAKDLEGRNPAAALRAWSEIDQKLVKDAALVPATSGVDWWYLSERTGNFQTSHLGPLLDQLWVQ